MTRLRFALVAWWFFFGLYLVAMGTVDALRWHNDPFYQGMSLRWWHSTLIIPGGVGIAYALALAVNWRVFYVLGFIVGAFFVLYNSYLLAITTDAGRMSSGGAWRAFVIVVSLATVAFNLWLARDTRRRSAGPLPDAREQKGS